MKFLVLALFVCAANAASFYPGFSGQNQFTQLRPTYNRVSASPPVFSPKTYPVATATAQAVVGPTSFVPAPSAPVVSAPVVPVPAVPATKTFYVNTNSEIITDSKDVRPDGFAYKFETADGTGAESVGTLKAVGDAQVLVFTGSYKYRNEDGKEVYLTYVADENGFQPNSDLLPVGPATPEPILRALEYIAKQPKYVEPTKY